MSNSNRPSTPSHCRSCGDAIENDAPHGCCPRCLLKAGIAALAAAPLHVRCPHCQHAIELVDDAPVRDIVCPACDTGFGLVDEATRTFDARRPARVGRFELIERLGVGGFGAVWKARDPELDRLVAVKVPRRGRLADDEVEKFLREARSAAQLRHPHIVAVHEVGRDDATVFLVSELIDGVTLADRLTTDRPSPEEAAGLCEQIARALQHAHEAGVVHRDLKPSNILLDAAGEPHVTDFGLAKRSAAEITMTIDGQILGTPAYMSPEQARGDGHAADARSDVYSLGVVLFELLTGEKPFRGNTRMLLQQVMHDEPPAVRRLNSRVPRDLETITLRCLEKDPARRYATAAEVADELRRARTGEPIRSRPISRFERAMRWCRRNPLPSALAASLVLTLGCGLLISGGAWYTAAQERRRAVDNARLARQNEVESRARLVRRYVAEGDRALDEGLPLRAAVWFAEAYRQDAEDPASTDSHRRRLGTLRRQLPRLTRAWLREPTVADARFSPDGRRVALHFGPHVELSDATTGAVVGAARSLPGRVDFVAFDPSGRRLVVTTAPPDPESDAPRTGASNVASDAAVSETSGFVEVLDTATGEPLFPRQEFSGLRGWLARFSSDGNTVCIVTTTDLHVLDAGTGEARFPPLCHDAPIDALELNSDGRRALVWVHVPELRSEVRLYDLVEGKTLGEPLRDHKLSAEGRAFSPSGDRFVTSRYDQTGGRGSGPSELQTWDATTGAPVGEPRRTADDVRATVFSPDGRFLFAPLRNGRIAAWGGSEAASPLVHPALEGPRIERWATSPDGASLAISRRVGAGAAVVVFRAARRDGGIDFTCEFSERVERLVFSPDGRRLLVTTDDRRQRRVDLHLVDLDSHERVTLSFERQYGELRAEFGSGGERLLTCSEELGARLWDLTGLGPAHRPAKSLDGRSVACMAVGGGRLAIGRGSADRDVEWNGAAAWGDVQTWDWRRGTRIALVTGLPARVTSLAFDAAARRQLATLADGSLALIELGSGEAGSGDADTGVSRAAGISWNVRPEPDERFLSATFGTDDEIVAYVGAYASRDGFGDFYGVRLEFRAATDGALRRTLRLPSHRRLVFAPVGGRCLRIDDDRRAVIFEAMAGTEAASLGRLPQEVESAVFDSQGRRLALTYGDGVVELRNAETGLVDAPLVRGATSMTVTPDRLDETPVRFSADGRRLLVRQDERQSQLFDARTGESLSPPFATQRWSGATVNDVPPVFAPGDDAVVQAGPGVFRVWDVSPEARTPEEFSAWAEVATGSRIDAVGGYSPTSRARLEPAWRQVRTSEGGAAASAGKNAEASAAGSHTVAWRRREASEQEANAADESRAPAPDPRHWFAARFHLERLLGTYPDDDDLKRRRDRADAAWRAALAQEDE